MAAVGDVTPAARQISKEICGAPAGPGAWRSVTSKAPPRVSSSSDTGATAALCWRMAGIRSSVKTGGMFSASTARAAASSGSKGGGTAGTAALPGTDVVVTIASSACGPRPRDLCHHRGITGTARSSAYSGFSPPHGGPPAVSLSCGAGRLGAVVDVEPVEEEGVDVGELGYLLVQ